MAYDQGDTATRMTVRAAIPEEYRKWGHQFTYHDEYSSDVADVFSCSECEVFITVVYNAYGAWSIAPPQGTLSLMQYEVALQSGCPGRMDRLQLAQKISDLRFDIKEMEASIEMARLSLQAKVHVKRRKIAERRK